MDSEFSVVSVFVTNKEDKTRGLKDIWAASYGLPGVETVLPMMLTGVNEGRVSLERLVSARSKVPAQVYGLWPRKGHLGIGQGTPRAPR